MVNAILGRVSKSLKVHTATFFHRPVNTQGDRALGTRNTSLEELTGLLDDFD